MLVVDEFDVMMTQMRLDKQFLSKIDQGVKYQKIFVSATTSVRAITRSKGVMNKPLIFKIKNEELTLEGIRQYYYVTDTPKDKIDTLMTMLNALKVTRGMIFCNRKDTVQRLIDSVSDQGGQLTFIHGQLSQYARNDIMSQLRTGIIHFLITSDLLSRGIDVQQMSMVINYDLPKDKELYIHRIGRCGRYGRTGRSVTFVHQIEVERLKEMEKFYNTEITEITDIGDFINSIINDRND